MLRYIIISAAVIAIAVFILTQIVGNRMKKNSMELFENRYEIIKASLEKNISSNMVIMDVISKDILNAKSDKNIIDILIGYKAKFSDLKEILLVKSTGYYSIEKKAFIDKTEYNLKDWYLQADKKGHFEPKSAKGDMIEIAKKIGKDDAGYVLYVKFDYSHIKRELNQTINNKGFEKFILVNSKGKLFLDTKEDYSTIQKFQNIAADDYKANVEKILAATNSISRFVSKINIVYSSALSVGDLVLVGIVPAKNVLGAVNMFVYLTDTSSGLSKITKSCLGVC
jgi:hypothetical protein